jgi:hypothetical protein
MGITNVRKLLEWESTAFVWVEVILEVGCGSDNYGFYGWETSQIHKRPWKSGALSAA